MSQNNWGLSSSSSESDDDDDRPVSKLRTDTVFYQQFLNGACHDEWPDQIAQRQLHQQQQQQHSFNHVHENQSMHSFGNISMKGESSRMSTSIISSSILNKTPDNFVFVDHGDRLQPVRVVNANEIPELNASIPFTPIPPPSIPIAPIPGPSGSVPSALLPPSNHNAKLEVAKLEEMIPNGEFEQNTQTTRIIPDEIIDFIDRPVDRRERKYCGVCDNNDCMCHPTVWYNLPAFYEEFVRMRRIENANEIARINAERAQNRQYRLSTSIIRDRINSQTTRIEHVPKHVPNRRIDPRLERSLFSGSPRRVVSPKKALNKTESSVFEPPNGDNVSSDSSSFSSQSSIHDISARLENNLLSEVSSDDDLSFAAFSNRQKLTKKEPPKKEPEEKVPKLQIDLKKKKVTRAKSTPKQKNLLLEKPPVLNKHDILSALTGDSQNDDQENVPSISSNEKNKKANAKPDEKNKKPVVQNKRKKAVKRAAKSVPKKKKTPISPISKTNLVDAMQSILPDSPISMDGEPAIVNDTAGSGNTLQAHQNTIEANSQRLQLPEQNGQSSQSDNSATSMRSLEQRLAEIVSPSRPKQTELGTADGTTAANKSTTNSSTQSEQSPAYESIADYPNNDTKNYNHMPNLSGDLAAATETIPSVTPASNGNNESPTNDTANHAQEKPAEQTVPSLSSSFDVPDIGAITEVFNVNEDIDFAAYTKDLEPTASKESISIGAFLNSNPKNDGINEIKPTKVKRIRIFIEDFGAHVKIPNGTVSAVNSEEPSDDDLEEDIPCDPLTLPNSNASRSAEDQLKSSCGVCSYEARHWKQLTKHYVRMHPDREIAISRLAKCFNLTDLNANQIEPIITNGPSGMLIQSLCYICNDRYNLSSLNWLMHFIAHTGEYEFRCKQCKKVISQDLHKECNSKGNERINGPHDFVDNVLYGHVCVLCSYVQLTKEKIQTHLENEHQQIVSDGNIKEIVLLKSAQPPTEALDDKNEPNLVEARQRHSIIQQPYATMSLSDDDDDDAQPSILTVDLTLSD